ncbi:hypothetical protein [Streptomyces sp. st77]|uniref:hypothetical protein n=1 Tax=Streptomyces sp. st77 TaxID=1828074 RepID=UPI000BFCD2B5|nr:hypothetical protein [Streptomyces sp. st77]
MRQTMSTAEENVKALEIAEQIAALLGELDSLQPGSVHAGPGRISGPGVEIHRNPDGAWAARTGR